MSAESIERLNKLYEHPEMIDLVVQQHRALAELFAEQASERLKLVLRLQRERA